MSSDDSSGSGSQFDGSGFDDTSASADDGGQEEANDWEVDVSDASEPRREKHEFTPADLEIPEQKTPQPSGNGGFQDETVDPYQPPESDVDPANTKPHPGVSNQGEVEIFTTSGVGVATLLGGPVAAVALLTYNFHEVGWEERVAPTLVVGLAACGVIFAIGYALPTGTSGIGIGSLAAAIVIAKRLNGQIREKLAVAPREKSNWTAAGFGCLSLVATFVLIFVVAFGIAFI